MTSPTGAESDAVVDFRLRGPRRLKDRVKTYAATHTQPGAYGNPRPMTINSALLELLTRALDAEEEEASDTGP